MSYRLVLRDARRPFALRLLWDVDQTDVISIPAPDPLPVGLAIVATGEGGGLGQIPDLMTYYNLAKA